MIFYYAKDKRWLFEEPTQGQKTMMDNIVKLIPESKKEREECINKGLASRFIDKNKSRYSRIKEGLQ